MNVRIHRFERSHHHSRPADYGPPVSHRVPTFVLSFSRIMRSFISFFVCFRESQSVFARDCLFSCEILLSSRTAGRIFARAAIQSRTKCEILRAEATRLLHERISSRGFGSFLTREDLSSRGKIIFARIESLFAQRKIVSREFSAGSREISRFSREIS